MQLLTHYVLHMLLYMHVCIHVTMYMWQNEIILSDVETSKDAPIVGSILALAFNWN